MLATRRVSRFALTGSGLRTPRGCEVKAGHGYYIGASSSPSFVVVLGVDGEVVRYVHAYSHAESRTERWIFAGLACSALDTLRNDAEQAAVNARNADASTAMGRLAQQIDRVCAERFASHGHAVDIARFDRFEVRVSAPRGVDVYGIAKTNGVVNDWDDDANEVTVECDRDGVDYLVGAGLKIVRERMTKRCPRD